MLQWTGAGLGLALGGGMMGCGRGFMACGRNQESYEILKQGDKFVLTEDPAVLIQRAYDLGYKYEKENGGCARCTVAALQDALPFVEQCEPLFRASSCVDGGATSTGLHSCGSFTGSGLVIAHVCGSTRKGSEFLGDGKLSKTLMQKVQKHYQEAYGSVLCTEVSEASQKDCPHVVGIAAQWVTEILLEEFT